MSIFRYSAVNDSNHTISGSMEANSSKEVVTSLRERGYYITDIKEESALNKDVDLNFLKKITLKDLALFSRQFAFTLQSGMPMLRCIELCIEQTENKVLQDVLRRAKEEVKRGRALSDALKYEDEMQFLEKVRIAQNFNNTVLLDQYAKEKMVRYLQRKNKVSNFLYYFPLIWKAQISIYRLGRNWIIMGMILFTICLGIYKMPFYWTLPFLQQEEIRYMLLLGSIFAVFRLTLRSMVQQLDSILEKATDGLFIPISENRIVKQFMVIPITIVCGEGIIMAFVVNSSIAQILLGCAILICATVLNLWLEVKYKNFLVKKDFILSIAVFLGALILTK